MIRTAKASGYTIEEIMRMRWEEVLQLQLALVHISKQDEAEIKKNQGKGLKMRR